MTPRLPPDRIRPPEWPPERVEQLTELYRAGASRDKMAEEMGITKNALSGKINRLFGDEIRAAVAALKAIPKAERVRVDRKTPFRKPKPTQPLAAAPEGGINWDGYNHRTHCHWPLTDPRAADFRFCGAGKLPDGSYCREHHQKAHRRPGEAY